MLLIFLTLTSYYLYQYLFESIFNYTHRLTEDEALTFASFTAAITVSRLGAMPALPTLPEVLGLIENRGGAGFDLSLLDALR